MTQCNEMGDPLLADDAVKAATDRIAWAMLVATEVQSPRMVWAERADEWRQYAAGVWESALRAARAAALPGEGERCSS